jgi:hypothetical protein
LQRDTLTGTIELVGKIIDLLGNVQIISEEISFIADCVTESALLTINTYFDIAIPDFDYDLADYRTYLSTLLAALSNSFDELVEIENAIKHNDSFLLSNILINEGIRGVQIPIYYNFYESVDHVFPNYKEYSFSLRSTFTTDVSYKDNFFNFNTNTMLPEIMDNSFGTRGKYYALISFDEINDFSNLQPVSAIENVVPEYKQVYVNVNASHVNLRNGEYIWYKFVVPETGKYYFTCKGDEDIYVELFNEITTGYSVDGRFALKIGGYTNKYTDEKGCYFNYYLECDNIIYIRIRKQNFNGMTGSTGVDFEISNTEDETAVHYHEYTIFTYFNEKNHICRCECGDIVSRPHVVSSSNLNVCIDCGGNVNSGFIAPFDVSELEEENIENMDIDIFDLELCCLSEKYSCKCNEGG